MQTKPKQRPGAFRLWGHSANPQCHSAGPLLVLVQSYKVSLMLGINEHIPSVLRPLPPVWLDDEDAPHGRRSSLWLAVSIPQLVSRLRVVHGQGLTDEWGSSALRDDCVWQTGSVCVCVFCFYHIQMWDFHLTRCSALRQVYETVEAPCRCQSSSYMWMDGTHDCVLEAKFKDQKLQNLQRIKSDFKLFRVIISSVSA